MVSLLGNFQFTVMTFISIGLAVATLVALVDASLRRAEFYEAAGKLTKRGWQLILGLALGTVLLLPGIGFLIAAVAAAVYFVDVRPALAAYKGRR